MNELWEIKDDFGKITIRSLPVKKETPKMFILDLGDGQERRVEKDRLNSVPNLWSTGRGTFYTSREMALQTWANHYSDAAARATAKYEAVRLLISHHGEVANYRGEVHENEG